MRILAQDDRALQTCVNSLHYTVLAVLLLVNLQYMLQDVALRVRVPATVCTAELYLHASHVEAALHHGSEIHLVVLVAGTSQDFDGCLATANLDDGEVGRCLYDAWHRWHLPGCPESLQEPL